MVPQSSGVAAGRTDETEIPSFSPPASGAEEWYVLFYGDPTGPFTLAEIERNGSPDILVWKAGLSDWLSLSEAKRKHAPAPQPPPSRPPLSSPAPARPAPRIEVPASFAPPVLAPTDPPRDLPSRPAPMRANPEPLNPDASRIILGDLGGGPAPAAAPQSSGSARTVADAPMGFSPVPSDASGIVLGGMEAYGMAPSADPGRLEKTLARLDAMVTAGAWSDADTIAQQILLESPEHPRALAVRGVHAARTAKFTESLKFFALAETYGKGSAELAGLRRKAAAELAASAQRNIAEKDKMVRDAGGAFVLDAERQEEMLALLWKHNEECAAAGRPEAMVNERDLQRLGIDTFRDAAIAYLATRQHERQAAIADADAAWNKFVEYSKTMKEEIGENLEAIRMLKDARARAMAVGRDPKAIDETIHRAQGNIEALTRFNEQLQLERRYWQGTERLMSATGVRVLLGISGLLATGAAGFLFYLVYFVNEPGLIPAFLGCATAAVLLWQLLYMCRVGSKILKNDPKPFFWKMVEGTSNGLLYLAALYLGFSWIVEKEQYGMLAIVPGAIGLVTWVATLFKGGSQKRQPPQVFSLQPATGWWYTDAKGERIGPMERAQLADAVRQRLAGPATFVWKAGMAEWRQLHSVPELADLRTLAVTGKGSPPPKAGSPATKAKSAGGGDWRSSPVLPIVIWFVVLLGATTAHVVSYSQYNARQMAKEQEEMAREFGESSATSREPIEMLPFLQGLSYGATLAAVILGFVMGVPVVLVGWATRQRVMGFTFMIVMMNVAIHFGCCTVILLSVSMCATLYQMKNASL